MGQLQSMIVIFIQYPWLAALLGAALVGLGHWSGRGAAVAAGLTWLLYAVYETGNKQRWWCTGECNIRVDLLLIYPILLVLTVVGLVSLLRARKEASG